MVKHCKTYLDGIPILHKTSAEQRHWDKCEVTFQPWLVVVGSSQDPGLPGDVNNNTARIADTITTPSTSTRMRRQASKSNSVIAKTSTKRQRP